MDEKDAPDALNSAVSGASFVVRYALEIRTQDGGVSFAVRVQPGAKREGVAGAYGDAVKIALQAPAVDGRANEALIRYLAELLQVPRMSVEIVAGLSSRSKVVRVAGVTSTDVETKLMRIEAV